MRLLFKIFLVAFVLLWSCNSGLFREQKSKAKPYFFSTKKNNQTPATTTQAHPALVAPEQRGNALSEGFTEPTLAEPVAYGLPPGAASDAVQSQPQENSIQADNKNASVLRKTAPSTAALPSTKHLRQLPKENGTAGNLLLAGTALAAILSTAGLLLFRQRARNVASWAKENKRKAWLVIGLSHTLLGFSGSFIGRVLHALGHEFSGTSTGILLVLAALSVLTYSAGTAGKLTLTRTFINKKLLLLSLIVSSFFLFLNVGNRNAADNTVSPLSTKIEQLTEYDNVLVQSTAIQLAALPEALQSPQLVDALAVLFLLILVLLLAFFFTLLAAISCTIACAGYGAIAILVMLGGTALLLLWAVAMVKAILDGVNRRKGRPLKYQDDKADKVLQEKQNPAKKPKSKYEWF